LELDRMDNASSLLSRIASLRDMERRLVRAAVEDRQALGAREMELCRWALAFARLDRLRVGPRDIDLFEQVAPFRHWLIEQLGWYVDPDRDRRIDWKGLRQFLPTLRTRLDLAHTHVLAQTADTVPPRRLEEEVRFRRLALVLGGGGGSGYCHLGTFAVLSELGIVPRLIVGSSMGAMTGLFRAVNETYDPAAVTLNLPRPSDLPTVFSPYRGFSRFGFPGSLELKARAVGRRIFSDALDIDIPPINELPIAFRAIGTGLRTGIGLALSEVEEQIAAAQSRFTPFALRKRAVLLAHVVRTMVDNPRFLHKVVFGSDEGLQDFNAVDAVGFSCAVPGIIHYDIHGRSDPSVDALVRLFAEHRLFRLTDGGVVSNVASRTAFECVQRGEIRSRNVFVLSLDAFAPLLNWNAPFIPVQQFVRASVLAERPYSDWHITYRQPPSPTAVLQSTRSIEAVIARTRRELEPHREFLSLSMRPLPPWERLRSDFPTDPGSA
jgi:predicted acylesterase/phospholipase RssA